MIEIDSSEKKGFSAHYAFIETPARRFVTVDVKLDAGESTAEVLEAIAEQRIENAVVKVVLHSEEEVAADECEIRRALESAAWATPVQREIENPPARLRAPDLAGGWSKPLAALEEYLKTTKFSEERKVQLRKAAEKLLKPEVES